MTLGLGLSLDYLNGGLTESPAVPEPSGIVIGDTDAGIVIGDPNA
jgi:hypothetical protein